MKMRSRTIWLLVLAAAVLIAAHLLPLYYLFSHRILPATLIVATLGLVIASHLGLLSPIYRFFGRRQKSLGK